MAPVRFAWDSLVTLIPIVEEHLGACKWIKQPFDPVLARLHVNKLVCMRKLRNEVVLLGLVERALVLPPARWLIA